MSGSGSIKKINTAGGDGYDTLLVDDVVMVVYKLHSNTVSTPAPESES